MPTGHTIVTLVRDRPGVLTRISGMLRRRGFNIASLAVGTSEIPGLSRMTFVVHGNELMVQQLVKQLQKLVDVAEASPLADETMIARELALIRVHSDSANRNQITQIVEIFRANIIDVAPDSMIVEVVGDEDKVESLKKLLSTFGVKEMIRTGRLAMMRGMADNVQSDVPRDTA